MTVLALAVGALVVTWALEAGTRDALTPGLQRSNWRDRPVTTGVGVLIGVVTITASGVLSSLQAAGVSVSDELEESVLITAAAVAGYGLLGLLDDVAGSGQSGGFRGHLRSLRAGRVTTGILKLGGGAALAVALVGFFIRSDLTRLLTDAAVIALAANTGNLLDRRPARATKVAAVAVVAFAIGAPALDPLGGPLVAVAAAAALVPGEVAERHMLGDSGANAVGGAVGLAIVLTAGPAGRNAAAAVLLVLNLVSEVVSFSRVIDAVPVLRALDRLGLKD